MDSYSLERNAASDHSADVGKMVDLGFGSQREVDDLMRLLVAGVESEPIAMAFFSIRPQNPPTEN